MCYGHHAAQTHFHTIYRYSTISVLNIQYLTIVLYTQVTLSSMFPWIDYSWKFLLFYSRRLFQEFYKNPNNKEIGIIEACFVDSMNILLVPFYSFTMDQMMQRLELRLLKH